MKCFTQVKLDDLDTEKPEGYHIRVDGSRVFVVGNDQRGVLYGVGWLLRCLEMRTNLQYC